MGKILVKPKRVSKVAKKYQTCVAAANHQGYTVFGFDDTKCWTGPNAPSSYDLYGLARGKCGTTRGGLDYGLSKLLLIPSALHSLFYSAALQLSMSTKP